MRALTAFSLVVWLVCVGCDAPVNDPSTAGNQATEEQLNSGVSAAADQSPAGDVADAPRPDTGDSEPMDYGDWLAPPENVNSRIAEVYPGLVRAAQAGESGSLATLAEVSQQIALQAASRGDEEPAYAFFGQAGKALRAAIEAGAQGLDENRINSVFYNEACALAHAGSVDAAFAAVSDAVDHGFNNFDMLESDTDMASVRESADYESKLAEWKRIAAEKMQELARRDLENGQSFPFELSAEDIEGNPQSLDALKGKVVIVDVWGTWCPPCRAEVPSFIKLQEKYADQGFQMIGLNYERQSSDEANLKAVVDYVEQNGINYPCIMGDRQTQSQIPGFRGYPTTLFIDRAGKVRMMVVGAHEFAYLEAIVSELLSEAT
jgi:thiol-disulfide isomerase/thioredoxin